MFMGFTEGIRAPVRRVQVYTSLMAGGKVAVFGVPSAAGARRAGLEQAPFALREAGLLEALAQTGATVVNLSDLSLFPFRADEDHPRERNVSGVACAARAAADEMGRALAEGFTVVLGGDCTLATGTLSGARHALGQPVGIVWVDANADLNTPESTPSGLLDGMALALALGRGPHEAASAGGTPPAVQPGHVALLGFRELDPGERAPIADLGLALPAVAIKKVGARATAALALDGVENDDGPVLVHFDVDVLDPAERVPSNILTPGTGLSLAEASDLLTALLASPRVVALEVTEYQPAEDPEGAGARRLIEMIVRAVARHLRGSAH
jgi:arginase